MKTNFPIKNQIWTPSYFGEYWGDFVNAFSINLFSKRGAVLSQIGLGPHTTKSDTADMDRIPSDMVEFDNYYWTFTSKVMKTDNLVNKFAADTLTNSPTDLNDADGIVYQNKLIVSRPTDLAMLNSASGTWDKTWWTGTLGQSALQNCSHPLATMGSAHLFVGDKNNMHDIFGGDTVYLNRYTIPDTENATIEWIKTTSDFVYLGVEIDDGEHKYMVVEFDPISEKSKEIYLNQKAMGFVWNDSFYLILEDGSIKIRSGSYALTPIFEKVAQFPVSKDAKVIKLPHRNGVSIYRDKPIFFLKEYAEGLYTPAGIYILDKDVGVYHWKALGDSHNYGCLAIQGYGVLYVDKDDFIFAGADVATTDYYSVTRGLFCDAWASSYPQRFSWIELPEIRSSELDDIWQNIAIFVKNYYDTNKITIQYKTEYAGDWANWSGTWKSDNSFTYSGSPYNLEVGNSVVILQGYGGGLIAHITDINTSTKTITIDKSVSGASGDMKFWIDTYKKVGTIELENGYEMISFPSQPLISPSIQVRLLIEEGGILSTKIQHKPNNILE